VFAILPLPTLGRGVICVTEMKSVTTYTREYMAWNLHLMSWKPGFQQVMVMKGRNVSGYHRNGKHIWYAFLEVLLIK